MPSENDLAPPNRPHPSPRLVVLLTLAMSLVVVACGNGALEIDTQDAPVCAAGSIDIPPEGGELLLFTWPGFIPETTIAGFERRNGIAVVQRFYTSNEDMLSQVQARAEAFDLIIPSDYMVDIMRRDGLLLPLDPIALPGTNNLDEIFDDRPYDPDGEYSVPYVWGTVGLGVNVNVVGTDADPSWGLIFDPDQLDLVAGRVSLLDEPRQAMAAALMYLGHSPNTRERAQIRAAGELIAAVRSDLGGFLSSGYARDLADGALDVAHGRSDVFFEAFESGADDYEYLIPTEGALAWVENMAVPITARHPCAAHSFIDFVLEEDNAADIANFTGFASPNVAAREFIDIELLRNPAIYPPSEVRETLQFLVDVGDLELVYIDEFARARG